MFKNKFSRTLAKPDAKLNFDGTVKTWPLFKEAMLKWADGEGFGYMLEGGQGICTIFQAASAASAKKTKGDDKGTITFATNRSWGAPGTGATPDKPHAEVV